MSQENKNEREDAPGLAARSGKKVYLVRHGKTEWNNHFRYQGATDVPLSDEGIEQARRVASRLSQLDVGAIISSPLKRAFATAQEIASRHKGISVETNPLFTEVNFGEWEGLTVPEIKAHSGEEIFYKWRRNELHVRVPGGEEPDAVYERAECAARELFARPCDNIVVVGHGALFRALMLPLVGAPRSDIFWKARIDNCSITSLNLDKRGFATISCINDTLHLHISYEKISDLPIV